MLEDHVKSPTTCRRMRDSCAGAHVDAFVHWMHAQGYGPTSCAQVCHGIANWTDWVNREAPSTDLALALELYCEALEKEGRLRSKSGRLDRTVSAGTLYVRFLREFGLSSGRPTKPGPVETWPILHAFHAWGCQHRGFTASTARTYEAALADFLTMAGDDPAKYNAQGLRGYVLERVSKHGAHRRETIICAIRAFLRFLVGTGNCQEGLLGALPSFARWRLSSVPQYLEPAVVEHVLDTCVPDCPVRRRDRAVLLMLVRLGLRGSDVERLTLADIDWGKAAVAVSGKSRRQEWLPLPQDVGDAIVDYIRHGRPCVDVAQVFVTARAPYKPLAHGSLFNIARTALERADIRSPSRGSHVFRHSAATAMLRQGASLQGIGAVLRHRSPATTMQYAKVDFGLLSEISQPWPEACHVD